MHLFFLFSHWFVVRIGLSVAELLAKQDKTGLGRILCSGSQIALINSVLLEYSYACLLTYCNIGLIYHDTHIWSTKPKILTV